VHKDSAGQRNARAPSARPLEAQGPSEVRSWKNEWDKAEVRPADALHTCYCTPEEADRMLVVDIGSLA
jgi:hypothetical protein